MPVRARMCRRSAAVSRVLIESLEARALLSVNMPAKLPDISALRVDHAIEASAWSGAAAPAATEGSFEDPLAGDDPPETDLPPLQGDANGDWSVNALDLNILASNWYMPDATWGKGDFTGDGVVNALDLNVLAGNWMATIPQPPVATPPIAYDWHTQVIDGVLNVWAPNPTDFGATYTVSDPEKLFGPDGIPNMESVRQGPTGDCYFLAAIGGTAFDRPSVIQDIVKNDNTGGWQVTFRWRNNSGTTVPVTFHTSRELSASLQVQTNGEVWVLVMEKAFAAFRTFNGVTSTNTMASIAWGFTGDAMRYIGQPYTSVYITGQSETFIYNQLSSARDAFRPVLYHTSASSPTMVSSHVYVITAVSTDESGQKRVTTYNPWGFYETRTLTDVLRNSAGVLVIANT